LREKIGYRAEIPEKIETQRLDVRTRLGDKRTAEGRDGVPNKQSTEEKSK